MDGYLTDHWVQLGLAFVAGAAIAVFVTRMVMARKIRALRDAQAAASSKTAAPQNLTPVSAVAEPSVVKQPEAGQRPAVVWPPFQATAPTVAEPIVAESVVTEPVPAEPIAEPIAEPVAELEDLPVFEEVPGPAAEPVTQPSNELVAEQIDELVDELNIEEQLGAAYFDVQVVPGLIDEPLPGVGWVPTTEPMKYDDVENTFEDEVVTVTPPESAPSVVPSELFLSKPVLTGAELETQAVTSPESSRVAALSAEDLKARIEETRRRIRHELEQPFMSEYETERPQPAPVAEPVQPVEVAAVAEVPVVAEAAVEAEEVAWPAPEPSPFSAVPEEPYVEFQLAPIDEPERVIEEEAPAADGPYVELLPESQVIAAPTQPLVPKADLDAELEHLSALSDDSVVAGATDRDGPLGPLKAKIEQTRGKLKAKAFDAMMNGDPLILAQQSATATETVTRAPIFDDELDKTIETGLSEDNS